MKTSQHQIEEKGIWLLVLIFISITGFAQKDTAIFVPEKGTYTLQTEAEQLSFKDYQELEVKDCRNMHFEIMDLYAPTDEIPWGGDDFLIMDNHLKDLGFEQINGGWGNWMQGPRFIHLELDRGLCACSVNKKYWPYQEAEGEILQWQITEEINCTKK